MIIIAVAAYQDQVSEHFGHCLSYVLFTVDNKKVVKKTTLPNPGHSPGVLPPFLASHHVNVIIAGGMGQKAIDLFDEHQIETIVGAKGKVDDAITAYLAGELRSSGSVCHQDETEKKCS